MHTTTKRIMEMSTMLTHSLSFRTVAKVCLGLLVVCGILFALMLNKIPTKVAFFIDGMTLQPPRLTVGQGSDISMKGVPHDYLTLTPTPEGFAWEVNPDYRDTLQYFKINNQNPNRIAIMDDDSQTIEISVPSPKEGAPVLKLSLHGSDIWDEWDDFSQQRDVMLRHFAVRYVAGHNGHYSARDTLGYMQQKDVRSFLHREGGQIALVILDEHTRVEGQGYVRQGRVNGERCKVQFFNLSTHCYATDSPDDAFNVDGVNYAMKASVKLTEWGAGHVMLRKDDGTLFVHFPKAIGYVETLDTLRSMGQNSGGIVTLRQAGQSSPLRSCVCLPQFSTQVSTDICSLMLDDEGVAVRDSRRDSTRLSHALHLVPTLQRLRLECGGGHLSCRLGYIDGSFVCSYLWPTLIVVFVLLLVVLGPYSPVRLKSTARYRLANTSQSKDYPLYLAMLILVAGGYCVAKSLIALKLSYTYPYFEKITGIVPVSTALMLLFFFTLAMVFCTPLVLRVAGQHRGIPKFPVALFVTLVVLFAGVLWVFFHLLDSAVSQGALQSYFPSEYAFLSNPFGWNDQPGISDSHRNVVYLLSLLEGLVLAVWGAWMKYLCARASANGKSTIGRLSSFRLVDWMEMAKRRVVAWSNALADRMIACMQMWVGERFTIVKPALGCADPKDELCLADRMGLWLGRLPLVGLLAALLLGVIIRSHFNTTVIIACVGVLALVLFFKTTFIAFMAALDTLFSWHLLLLLALVFVGRLMGNFGTAFITLGVVFGLSHALSSVKFDDNNTPDTQEGLQPLEVLWQMLFISCAYIACAMVADNGYVTNFLGFMGAFICFYFLMQQPGWNSILRGHINRHTRRCVYAYIASVLVVAVFLPHLASRLYDPREVNYNRMARRVMLYSNFDRLQDAGYRYTETDAEFMVVMSHAMQRRDGDDPLSSDHHMLHPSVSTGQSPVVLNDLSMPLAFFGAYGTWMTTAVFFLLLLALVSLVMNYSLGYKMRNSALTREMQWRLLAVMMWVGTTLYIYFSYLGWFPFTGRLIPGYGVDSAGEALETALLLAFMAAPSCIVGGSRQVLTCPGAEEHATHSADDLWATDEGSAREPSPPASKDRKDGETGWSFDDL